MATGGQVDLSSEASLSSDPETYEPPVNVPYETYRPNDPIANIPHEIYRPDNNKRPSENATSDKKRVTLVDHCAPSWGDTPPVSLPSTAHLRTITPPKKCAPLFVQPDPAAIAAYFAAKQYK